MKLLQSKDININYAPQIVSVEHFFVHPNPEVVNLKCCTIGGFTTIVSKNMQPGLYVYFPTECKITSSFLYSNNLFRDNLLNKDQTQKGFFESNGRVKIVRLKGVPSEGVLMPITSLYNWITTLNGSDNNQIDGIEVNTTFDAIDKYILATKYTVSKQYTKRKDPNAVNIKPFKKFSKVLINQFRFHYDTIILKRTPWVVNPNSLISLTYKVHGASGISANVLCREKLSWKQKFVQWLTKTPQYQYDNLYSSRKVIKNNGISNFYSYNIWKYANEIVAPKLSKGMTA